MVLRTCGGATCHVSWWQGARRPVRLISNHLNIHEQQLSGPRPLRCCTPAQPANISLTQHQAGGQDADDEDVTTPQNYYVSCFSVLILTSPPISCLPSLQEIIPRFPSSTSLPHPGPSQGPLATAVHRTMGGLQGLC